jgi:hypothetical protein
MATQDTILVLTNRELWPLVGAIVIVATAWTLGLLGLRGTTSTFRRIVLILLRGLALIFFLFLCFGPALQERKLTPIQDRLALMVDASESMTLPASDQSRSEQVKRFLASQSAELDRLAQNYQLDTYRFDDTLKPVSRAELGRTPTGDRTDLLTALAALGEVQSNEQPALAGVILISDGSDTERLAGEHWPEAADEVLSALHAPINTFSVGADGVFKDLAITRVRVDDFAFIRNAIDVEVELHSVGLPELSVPLVLEGAGRNLASAVVKVPSGGAATVTLRFVPDRVGKAAYRVTTPLVEGEQVAQNNVFSFVARVIRDKLRVLHVVGRPSWDERFLREVLKRNPNVDLVSFFILRTLSDTTDVSQDELSLIPFPVEKLFRSELDTFDIVIFQNFNHGPYQVGYYLGELAEYVQRGGGFLMVGGDLSFGAGGYAASLIEDVLPVRLRPGDDLRAQEFLPQPTERGLRHPVLDLGEADIWAHLPPLKSYNLTESRKEGTVMLLQHPFEHSGKDNAPLLAIREVGRGRTAALLTDGSWMWNMAYMGQGGTPRPYHRFWNNLLRWLSRDPALEPLSLQASSVRYQPGEAVKLSVRVQGAALPPQTSLVFLDASRNTIVERQKVVLGEQGRAELSWTPPGPGAFAARLEMNDGSQITNQIEEAFVVDALSAELSHPAPRPELLARLSQGTKGVSSSVEHGKIAKAAINTSQHYRVDSATTRPLISYWWVLCGLCLAFATEWWLRRHWGFG